MMNKTKHIQAPVKAFQTFKQVSTVNCTNTSLQIIVQKAKKLHSRGSISFLSEVDSKIRSNNIQLHHSKSMSFRKGVGIHDKSDKKQQRVEGVQPDLMSLSPIFSMPFFSSTEFSILRILCGSVNVRVTSIKKNTSKRFSVHFLQLYYQIEINILPTWLASASLSMCKSECESS